MKLCLQWQMMVKWPQPLREYLFFLVGIHIYTGWQYPLWNLECGDPSQRRGRQLPNFLRIVCTQCHTVTHVDLSIAFLQTYRIPGEFQLSRIICTLHHKMSASFTSSFPLPFWGCETDYLHRWLHNTLIYLRWSEGMKLCLQWQMMVKYTNPALALFNWVP